MNFLVVLCLVAFATDVYMYKATGNVSFVFWGVMCGLSAFTCIDKEQPNDKR